MFTEKKAEKYFFFRGRGEALVSEQKAEHCIFRENDQGEKNVLKSE